MPSAVGPSLLVFIVAAWAPIGWAARIQESSSRAASAENTTRSAYKVHLLLSRHGLSCAELIEHWISKYDWNGRTGIIDPELTGAGIYGSDLAGKDVERWLREKDLDLDAVVSSQLLRELQSALIMYPQHTDPIQVAPFLEKERHGVSNRAKTRKQQVDDLVKVTASSSNATGMPGQVNYKWLDRFGAETGDWQKFLHFLEQGFLPELVAKKNKPPGSTIVVAIVTHSMYIKDSVDKCRHFWKSKPAFNQVLDLEYMFTNIDPSPGSADATPRRILAHAGESSCRQVSPGLELRKSEICIQDIGKQCIAPIKKEAGSPEVLWQQTAEHAIFEAAKAIYGLEREQKEEQEKLEKDNLLLQNAEKRGHVACTRSNWFSSCKPESLCVKSMMGHCTLKDDYNPEVLRDRIVKKSIAAVRLETRIRDAKNELRQRRSKECWSGGVPKTYEFLHQGLAPQTAPRVQDLAFGSALDE